MRAAWAVLVVSAFLSVGCNTSTCNRDADSLTVKNSDGVRATNVWFSGAYRDPKQTLPVGESGYQYLPPARTITFEHDLGSVPFYAISLAFDDNGSLAPTAGNQALLECMDDHVIQIKNDTCSDFYIWVQTEGSGVHSSEPTDCFGNPNPYFGTAGDAGFADESAGAGGMQP